MENLLRRIELIVASKGGQMYSNIKEESNVTQAHMHVKLDKQIFFGDIVYISCDP